MLGGFGGNNEGRKVSWEVYSSYPDGSHGRWKRHGKSYIITRNIKKSRSIGLDWMREAFRRNKSKLPKAHEHAGIALFLK
jgi:hypothetical protein